MNNPTHRAAALSALIDARQLLGGEPTPSAGTAGQVCATIAVAEALLALERRVELASHIADAIRRLA